MTVMQDYKIAIASKNKEIKKISFRFRNFRNLPLKKKTTIKKSNIYPMSEFNYTGFHFHAEEQ